MKDQALPLRALNHISRVCKDVATSAAFYRDVLGFSEIKRPSSFEFEGAWLFNYGIGIHLIGGQPVARSSKIDPKSDHLSFQVDCLKAVAEQLKLLGLDFVKQEIDEAGVHVTQLFFHDPDNNMIEICNCDLIPVIPLDSSMVCSSCISAGLASALSSHLPEMSEPSASSSYHHSPGTSCVSEDDSFAPIQVSHSDLLSSMVHNSTPHTLGAASSLRRACSANYLISASFRRDAKECQDLDLDLAGGAADMANKLTTKRSLAHLAI